MQDHSTHEVPAPPPLSQVVLADSLNFAGFSLAFLTWTLVYHSTGGTDCAGNPHIYAALDWAKPDRTIPLALAILFVAA